MNYIYHRVPKDMRGNTLFPLNRLKEKYPDLYDVEVQKYVCREEIMQHELPILNCFWNDVLHFSAVHPSVIRQLLIEAGDTQSVEIECFEIDPHIFDPKKTIVFLNKHTNKDDKLKIDNFTEYDPENIGLYSTVPKETKDYYKEMISQNKRPLLFHKIPHILFEGVIDISGLKIIY